jgi:hypothetical protein
MRFRRPHLLLALGALAAALAAAAETTASARTVWLCKPGQAPDPGKVRSEAGAYAARPSAPLAPTARSATQ